MIGVVLRGLALAALVVSLSRPAAATPQNLDFEIVAPATSLPVGWSLATGEDGAGAAITTDTDTVAAGRRSLKIERDSAAGATRLAQQFAAASLGTGGARRLRWSGVVHAVPTVAASLWLRVDGAAGPLYLDSRGDAREPDTNVDAEAPTASNGAAEWRRFTLELPLPSDAEEVAVGVAVRGAGVARFDALAFEIVDAATAPPAAPVARRYVEAALAIMREHSLHTASVDWSALRASTFELARGARVPAETHAALRYALRALGDRHSYLQSPAATEQLRSTAVANARTRQALIDPEGRLLDESIGYLLVPGFAGGTANAQVEFANDIKNIVQQYDSMGVCGWVIDLRRNSGGNLWPMLAGIGPLLGDGDAAASVYPDGRRTPVWYRDGQAGFGDFVQLRVPQPYRLRARSAPVALLTGRGTASSAEVLVLAFAGRERTRTFGAPTRGLSAGNRTFALADGAALVLTVAGTMDRHGRLPLGPLPPDVPVAVRGAGSEGGEDAALAAAQDWLATQPPCA